MFVDLALLDFSKNVNRVLLDFSKNVDRMHHDEEAINRECVGLV